MSRFPFGRWVLPAAAVDSADGDGLRLTDGADLVPDAHRGQRSQIVNLSEDMAVWASGVARLGRLALVCYGRTSRIVHSLVIQRGRLTDDRRLIPVQRVTGCSSHGIQTNLRSAEWPGLPRFDVDRRIRAAVVACLQHDRQLSQLPADALSVSVEDQRVRLAGPVGWQAIGRRAAQLIVAIPGVLAVDADIINDTPLLIEHRWRCHLPP
jgi:hypothetical protein